MSDAVASKAVSESALETTYMVLPEHTNAMGNIFGGTIMSWIDIIAACISYRHCRSVVVTASMDDLHFIHPVLLGNLVMLKGCVNFTGRTSLEIGVKVIAENPLTGAQSHTASAYLTFVALDETGKPRIIPQALAQTPDEVRRFEEGRQRRDLRLERRKMFQRR